MKLYPLKDVGSKIYNICECGHPNFFHGGYRDDCHTCECPKYEFEQELTMRALIELENPKRKYYWETWQHSDTKHFQPKVEDEK